MVEEVSNKLEDFIQFYDLEKSQISESTEMAHFYSKMESELEKLKNHQFFTLPTQ